MKWIPRFALIYLFGVYGGIGWAVGVLACMIVLDLITQENEYTIKIIK